MLFQGLQVLCSTAAVYGIGTLGLRLCSSRSSASHRCGRKPTNSAGDQQAAVCCKGVSGDQSQLPNPPEPGRRRWEDSGEGRGQPLLKDCLSFIRPKSEYLHHERLHDAGAFETRSVTAPCVPASDLRNPGHRLKTRNEYGPLLLSQTRQVRESGAARGGTTPRFHSWWPPILTGM
ncbi:uncharacterized protein LOC110321943 [Mus pahari]|uniref:uncharacterized protein LOC110321943 n=1 Tax=Mus pahari TaxID=10093 RepID=UPI001114D226|nr:uncharacterized protein LOC110321943 [Mus pahari]